jgi:hypothetical protein
VISRAILLGALIAASIMPASAQGPQNTTALVNVQIVSVRTGEILRNHAVLSQDGIIKAVAPARSFRAPEGARVIDGRGRYLVSGLIDAHVHIEEYLDARPNFGDGPIFLRSGITSIFNLRGFPEHLQMREQIQRGELIAPMLYTSGEFMNEPRVTTPAQAAAEVRAQAAAGYDLIKFREVVDHDVGVLTTTGVDLETFAAIHQAAREVGLPVLGHAPHGLGLRAVEDHGLALAHVGELLQLHHSPRQVPASAKLFVAASVLLLVATLVLLLAMLFVGRSRKPTNWMPVWFASAAVAASVLAAAIARALLPGGAAYGSYFIIALLVLILAGTGAAGAWLVIHGFRGSAERRPRYLHRSAVIASGLAALIIAGSGVWAAVPMALRSTPAALNDTAQRLARSGAPIVTTLILYDELGRLLRGGEQARISPKAVELMSPGFQEWNAGMRDRLGKLGWERWLSIEGHITQYDALAKDMALALHRAGVPLVAGTDAFGVGIVPPGESLHAELDILVEAGLTPLEALRTATTNPARLLGREKEFGDIAPGMRADMLLVNGNPLEDLRVLRTPAAIMSRGNWLPRGELDKMVSDAARL